MQETLFITLYVTCPFVSSFNVKKNCDVLQFLWLLTQLACGDNHVTSVLYMYVCMQWLLYRQKQQSNSLLLNCNWFFKHFSVLQMKVCFKVAAVSPHTLSASLIKLCSPPATYTQTNVASAWIPQIAGFWVRGQTMQPDWQLWLKPLKCDV